ncbi:MAG: protein kinase domain-containing protein [Planctomycetota bacterium]|jgi:serine/threonine protein kinase/tetratricopeptide (TPR) repeat protein
MAGSIDDNHKNIIKEAVQHFIDAQLRDEKPDIDEFVRQYPGLGRQIRQSIQDMQKIDALFDSLVQADQSDFEDTVTGRHLIGQKVESFEIVEMIGQGGMGVVYLAHDTKLDRSVAIKSMPAELARDPIVRARFQREAKLLASLSHPNIAVIHDILEQDEGAGYLVLEYVPGETLAGRIAREPLELAEALSIGQQVAEAVSAAHEKSVVHRDLKPGNIKITPDGKVKVLDFGLAKAPVSEGKNGEATTTQPGRVIGTPAYMSPEQARGKATDHRTDIWSFGCIMYQMLTGHLPFGGQTATDTLVHIIEREPNWELLPQKTPMNIRVLLRCCLEKDPRRRLRDIGDAGIEINETLSLHATGLAVTIPAKSRRMATIISAVIIIVVSTIAVWFISSKQTQPASKEIRLAVLPFENLGPAEDEYFAAGITDAITARLAGISGLGVISRQSAIQYEKREGGTRKIARELGVDYILEGTVQRERPSDPTSRVRIIPQLIRASDDTHVWAQTYDNDMSEVFAVQSDLAERVAQALDITLLEPERQALKSRPTENIEAYEYYLRGNEYFYRSELENDWGIAIRMYEGAVELDPTLALAYAQLSMVHSRMYSHSYDRSEERLALAKQAVDKAFQLNPGLSEAHMALGFYYYWGHLDYDHALEQFAIARKSQPNNSEVLRGIGWVQRRQGKFEQALANLKRACELDPLSNLLSATVAQTFMLLRKYPEAERYYERAISLAPDLSARYVNKAWLYVRWKGNTEKARAILEGALHNIKSVEYPDIVNSLVNIEMYDGNYQEALDRLSLKSEDIDHNWRFMPKALRYAPIYGYMNKKELAKKYYDEARNILEAKIQQQRQDARFHSSLGVAYAGLGRKEDAIREGKLAVEMLPVSKEAMTGPHLVDDLARINVMVGEFDAAIDQLELLLSIPSTLSVPLLRLDPAWDPLRDHPRFKKLLETGE